MIVTASGYISLTPHSSANQQIQKWGKKCKFRRRILSFTRNKGKVLDVFGHDMDEKEGSFCRKQQRQKGVK